MPPKVGYAMHSGQQTPSLQEARIACNSFVEQLGSLRQLLPCMDSIGCVGEELLGALVKVVCHKIGCGGFLDRRLFSRGDFGLQLIGDCLGNFALDREDVIQRPIIMLCPEMCISPGVDQLGSHTYAIGGALYTPF